jgi:hypothetical protein
MAKEAVNASIGIRALSSRFDMMPSFLPGKESLLGTIILDGEVPVKTSS